MLRVVPPPRALLVCQDAVVRQQLERRIAADILDYESLADEDEALRRFDSEFCPVVVTSCLAMVSKLRARPAVVPFVVYVALDVARKLRAAIAQPPFKTEAQRVELTAKFGLCGLDRVPPASAASRSATEARRCGLTVKGHAGENPFIMTQALAAAERLRARAASVHMVMHKFCG